MLLTISIIILCTLIENIARCVLSEFITLSYNPGAAFGILRDTPGVALILSSLAFVLVILVCIFTKIRPLMRIGLAVMAGGALSNLLERIFAGYVVDWIAFPFFDLSFNLADVEISLGALIAFIAWL